MTAQERRGAVEDYAASLGFDACGVASADAPVDPENRLGDWLARGYHADMGWMESTAAVRRDVRLKLPGARSVVVVARNYYSRTPRSVPGTGRVARYAWGRDYHRALRSSLHALGQFLAGLEPGAEYYACIDSGPVLEKAWAARSGLGWIGKNSLVLRAGLGSWFFLGVLVTTVDIAPDTPALDRCGSCTACLDACPTEAIVSPRVVDAGRCISYHTIENRGDIPEDQARQFGDWIFGCDICQDVCPWNRKPEPTTEPDFLPRDEQAHLDLDIVEGLDDGGFLERFAGSPLMRAKRAGLQRNAAIVRDNLSNRDQ